MTARQPVSEAALPAEALIRYVLTAHACFGVGTVCSDSPYLGSRRPLGGRCPLNTVPPRLRGVRRGGRSPRAAVWRAAALGSSGRKVKRGGIRG